MSNPESKSQRATETTRAFKSRRALLWLGGIAVLVVGFLVAAIVLPANSPTPGTGGPDVRVPRMENVPPDQAPRMKLEVEKQQPEHR